MEKNIIELKNITKHYNGKIILKEINFNIKEGEFITLLGPSGCGKTTSLRLIGGFENPDSGEILFENTNLTNISPDKREINTVFQNYALFPHLNVFNNIAFGLKIKKKKNEYIKKEVNYFLKLVGLEGFKNYKIETLSGGQKQRVAIARALINKPKILLLDEPMSALDSKLRKKMQIELKLLQEEIGITFILVTHDQEEALSMSDRIIIMNNGVIQQIGTPSEIYNDPENLWIAQFIGESNIITDAVFIQDFLVKIDNKQIPCNISGFGKNETQIDIIIRPEDIDIVEWHTGFFDGVIENLVFKGVYWAILVKCENRNFLIHTTDKVQKNTNVGIKWNIEDIHIMWKEIND